MLPDITDSDLKHAQEYLQFLGDDVTAPSIGWDKGAVIQNSSALEMIELRRAEILLMLAWYRARIVREIAERLVSEDK